MREPEGTASHPTSGHPPGRSILSVPGRSGRTPNVTRIDRTPRPCAGAASTVDGTPCPADGMAVPSDGMTVPSDGVSSPSPGCARHRMDRASRSMPLALRATAHLLDALDPRAIGPSARPVRCRALFRRWRRGFSRPWLRPMRTTCGSIRCDAPSVRWDALTTRRKARSISRAGAP